MTTTFPSMFLLIILTPACHDVRSETRPSLQLFGVPSPLHRDLRGGAVNFAEIVGRQFEGHCSDVLLLARELRGPRNRNDPWFLGQQPGERDLSRCRLLAFCDLAKQIDQSLIRFSSLWRKARDDVAEIGTVEGRVFVDLSCEEALPQWAKWNEADSEFLQG